MSSFEISCEHCGSRYLLPASLREALRGMTVTCSVCTREWTPLPADGRGVAGGPRPGGSMPAIALHHYLQTNPYSYATAPPAAAEGTAAVPASGMGPTLRVAATGPDFELRATYELGARSFLIGRRGCHLDLLRADEIPERAIRIRRSERGFQFEGLGGFLIPLGPVRISSGRIDPGSRLELELGPYRVELESSSSPGHPIADLEAAGTAAPRPAPPPAPAPVADMSQTVRGLGSMGFDTRRFSDPLETLDVGLLGLDPPIRGETFWIKKSPALVGRTTGDILVGDARVSGKHAQIDILGLDQYAIKDLASTNGTTVNDRPASTTRLRDGDVVGLGGVRLQFVARPKKRRE
jgi:hypothetical protein